MLCWQLKKPKPETQLEASRLISHHGVPMFAMGCFYSLNVPASEPPACARSPLSLWLDLALSRDEVRH